MEAPSANVLSAHLKLNVNLFKSVRPTALLGTAICKRLSFTVNFAVPTLEKFQPPVDFSITASDPEGEEENFEGILADDPIKTRSIESDQNENIYSSFTQSITNSVVDTINTGITGIIPVIFPLIGAILVIEIVFYVFKALILDYDIKPGAINSDGSMIDWDEYVEHYGQGDPDIYADYFNEDE